MIATAPLTPRTHRERMGRVVARVGSTGGIAPDVPGIGDIPFLDGCYEESVALISLGDHDILRGERSVGMGRIFIEGGAIFFRGRYTTTSPRGLIGFRALLASGRVTRWSMAVELIDFDERGVRKARVFEVSPTFHPRDPATRTISVGESDHLTPSAEQGIMSPLRLRL